MDSEQKKMNRILHLYDRLNNGNVIYLQDEINNSGVSERSVKRDLAELRNYLAEKAANGECRKEIVYDRIRNCYYLTEEENNLPDYWKIYTIAKILLGSKGLSKREMGQITEYLIGLCGNGSERKEVKKNLANELLNYHGPNHGKDLIEVIWILAQAVEHQNLLEVRYKRLEEKQEVERILEPVGVMFSEYYFYLLAFIKGIREEKGNKVNPTIYRIDRIQDVKVLEEHFQIPYSEKFEEQKYRDSTPLMFGGDIHRLKFWYSGPSLEAVLDRIPTARVVKEEEGKWMLSAEVIGNGAEMWLRGQEGYVHLL